MATSLGTAGRQITRILMAAIALVCIHNRLNADEMGQNQPPIAVATFSPSMPARGEAVVLSASSSYDPDDQPSPLIYGWEYVSGPILDLTFEDNAADTMEVSWNASTDGLYLFELTVSDGDESDAHQFEVIVGDALYLNMPTEIEEGGDPILCELVINRELTTELSVDLSPSDPSRLVIPSSPLKLAPGETVLHFEIEAIDDNEINSSHEVMITASASHWMSAEASLTVRDNESPRIVVYQGNQRVGETTSISRAAEVEGYYVDHEFVIRNSGDTPLRLTSSPIVWLSGENASSFEVIQPDSAMLNAGDQSHFEIRFIGKEGAPVTVTIESNDPTNPNYQFELFGGFATIEIHTEERGSCGIGAADSYDLVLMVTCILSLLLVSKACRPAGLLGRTEAQPSRPTVGN